MLPILKVWEYLWVLFFESLFSASSGKNKKTGAQPARRPSRLHLLGKLDKEELLETALDQVRPFVYLA